MPILYLINTTTDSNGQLISIPHALETGEKKIVPPYHVLIYPCLDERYLRKWFLKDCPDIFQGDPSVTIKTVVDDIKLRSKVMANNLFIFTDPCLAYLRSYLLRSCPPKSYTEEYGENALNLSIFEELTEKMFEKECIEKYLPHLSKKHQIKTIWDNTFKEVISSIDQFEQYMGKI